MPTKNVTAIILSRKDFGETDRLISAFSLEEGKIKILAKGSRKLKSKMAGHIEPFSVGKYFLATGKSFFILAGADKLNTHEKIISDIELYKDASYICELVELLIEQEKNEAIFNLLKDTLAIIEKASQTKREIIIRYFEYNLLSFLGYEPELTRCKKCRTTLKEQKKYAGNFEGVCCDNCQAKNQTINLNTLKILRVLRKNDVNEILKIKDIEKYNDNLKEVISPFIHDILPRQIKSYEL